MTREVATLIVQARRMAFQSRVVSVEVGRSAGVLDPF